MNKLLGVLIGLCLSSTSVHAQFNDAGWSIVYQENFDSAFIAVHGQTFGTDGWLMFQLLNGGAITVANGYAQLTAEDFWNAALIRSADILPSEYKVRTKIGFIDYDLTKYEQADYDHPDFNTHGGYYENGVYFLTITDDTCSGFECAEYWWHYHRKMVIDVDNHINYGETTQTFHPVYMVYMAPQINSGGNLLRTWDGNAWDKTAWNWNVAATYDYSTWYYAELEKRDSHLVLRLYDESQQIIEETTPVSLAEVNGMDSPIEYLYIGEPHTDDYEGSARIDEITLLAYDSVTVGIGDDGTTTLPTGITLSQNYPNPFNAGTSMEVTLERPTAISIRLYNSLGHPVVTLQSGMMPAGQHTLSWDGKDASGLEAPSGVYWCRLSTGTHQITRKMLLLQ